VSNSSENFGDRRPPHSQADAGQKGKWPSGPDPDEGRPPGGSARRPADQGETPSPFGRRPVRNSPAQAPRPDLGLLRFLVGLALILSLASLALSGYLIYSYMSIRQSAAEMLDSALLALEDLLDEGLYYEYGFEQTFPISSEVPVQEDLVFPFQGTIPINTTIQVPIDAGVLGRFTLDVPISTSVYIDTEVPVRIDETFEFSTTIPVSMTIPIDLDPEDPALQGFADGLRQWLLELRRSVGPPAP
jgi:hypothetical protein